jgi:excinuclease ABC subunit C
MSSQAFEFEADVSESEPEKPAGRSSAFDFRAALSRLPDSPGIYRMISASGIVLYVGKAKNLKNRVRSYFQNAAGLAPKVQALMQHVARFDYIVTDSEVEALILEYNLVQKHMPKYNILLKDDKKFPWIGLSAEPFPRLFVTREPSGRGRFFGPFLSSADMYRTLEVIRKHFPLRQRRKPLFKTRPCMNYYIGACSGPCQALVTPEEYAETVKQVELFLKGKADDLLERLEAEMRQASDDLQFERAAKLRDRYRVVRDVVIHQKMVTPDVTVNQDVVALAADARRCAVVVLNIRRGKLIGSRPHEMSLLYGATPNEAYQAFLAQYYQKAQSTDADDLPDEIILHYPADEAFRAWLEQRTGTGSEPDADTGVNRKNIKRKPHRKITLTYPKKGLKKELLDLAVKNAGEVLGQAQTLEAKNYRNDPIRALLDLQEALGLADLPARMECYDISHFQGSETVASMVVFNHGVPDKKAYRRFRIRSAEGAPDDFLSMREVITRRFGRAVAGPDGSAQEGWEAPDLVIIDGGKGQLSSAVEALTALGLDDQPIISLAKKFEEVYRPGESHPVLLPRDSGALFVLQQIRDEAHRFAITYHRQRRGAKSTKSALDEIPGIGETRRKTLLKHFGSVEKIRQASVEELAALSGFNTRIAQAIFEKLQSQ